MKRSAQLIFINILLMASILISLYALVNDDQTETLTVNATRLEQRIEELAKYGKTPEGGVNRVAFSEKDIQSREYILSLMKEAGLKVHIDESGNIIAASAEELGLSFISMPSGAGHDAQNMAKISPTGMIFVPSVGGVSHSPKEFTLTKDITNGANILLHTILKIDRTF
jgi:hypothetical protein